MDVEEDRSLETLIDCPHCGHAAQLGDLHWADFNGLREETLRPETLNEALALIKLEMQGLDFGCPECGERIVFWRVAEQLYDETYATAGTVEQQTIDDVDDETLVTLGRDPEEFDR